MQRSGNPSDGTTRVTCVDKSNVTRGCQLFRKIYREIATDFPNIETDESYIDAFTMWLVRQPEFYDVVVVPNMFGDIVTDLASALQGGMGIQQARILVSIICCLNQFMVQHLKSRQGPSQSNSNVEFCSTNV